MTAPAIDHPHHAATVVCPWCPRPAGAAYTPPGLAAPETAGLTERQVAVLRAAADGLTRPETCRLLDLTPAMVNYDLARAFRALGAADSAHAVLLALRAGVIV